MKIKKTIFASREEWLKAREGKIGGSDAGSILGMTPWRSNVDLYREKIGLQDPADLSENPLVQYGIKAEPLIRELFRIDYPALQVLYEENNMFTNTDYPWAHVSLDAWLEEGETGKRGVLEIKTATVSSSLAAAKWKDNNLPQSYFAQVLHEMAVYNADFAYLRALLHYPRDGEPDRISIKDYYIDRKEVEEDIAYLMAKEKEFSECMKTRTEPPRILPTW